MGVDPLQFQQMQDRLDRARENSRLGPKRDRPRVRLNKAVEDEAVLHDDIRKECSKRGWLPLHGSMAHKTFRTPGEPDFVCLLPYGVTVFIECKTKDGKLSIHQQGVALWMRRLGHEFHVVRCLGDFIEICDGLLKSKGTG